MSENTHEIQSASKPETRKIHPRKPLSRRAIKKQLNEERERATHDPLTGLLNRAGFQEAYTREVARIKRSIFESSIEQHPVRRDSKAIVIYFDLNEFKQINKRYGHAGGDEKLKQAAQSMMEASRPSDIVARMGGDEFIMVLPSNDIESGKGYWENTLFPILNKNGISVSAGVCELDPEHPEGSIALADQLQSNAKETSRSTSNNTQIIFAE